MKYALYTLGIILLGIALKKFFECLPVLTGFLFRKLIRHPVILKVLLGTFAVVVVLFAAGGIIYLFYIWQNPGG